MEAQEHIGMHVLRREAERLGCVLVTQECVDDLARGNARGSRMERLVADTQMALYYLMDDYRLGWRAKRRVQKIRRGLLEALREPRGR